MRDIRFREWDQEREDMISGHGMSYSEREEFDDSVGFRFEHEEDLDYTGRQSETDCNGTPYRVLEQYTGLDDINGKPIYEGDLFEHRFGYMVFDDTPHNEMGVEYGVVVFDDGQFGVRTPGWGVRSLHDLLLRNGHLDDMPKDDLFVMKIAGNIHENPELLN